MYMSVSALQTKTPSNLHDIANMSFRLELWIGTRSTSAGQSLRAGNVSFAQAAFDAAVRDWPDRRFSLRQGIRLIR